MKLLYLADIRFPMERANGIQTVQTCHALARRGVDVELMVRRSDARSDEECLGFFGLPPHPNLTLRRVPGRGRLGFVTSSLKQLARKWDLIFTRDLLLADLMMRITATPIVYEAHTVSAVFAEERAELYGDGPSPKRSKLRRLDAREARVFRGAGGVVAITEGLRRSLEERHGASAHTVVVPDGCSVPEEMPAYAAGRKIYYVGQLYPWKGVDVLIDAMAELDDAELVIVGGLPGERDLDRLRARTVADGLDARVTFLGFVPPPALDAATNEAAAFVVPNLDSLTARLFTSPLKLFEAMARGRPIVASDLPSVREILTTEVNALLVPPGDAGALADALRRVLDDGVLAGELRAQAFADVHAYSWDRRADALTGFMHAVLESHRRQSP